MKKLEIIIKKFKKNKGETLSETLFALLIIALALIMLPGAVVSASKVNHAVKNTTLFGSAGAENSIAGSIVQITVTESASGEGVGETSDVNGISVKGYEGNNGTIEFYRFGY